uniref:MFS domain-containing protein n=1 Tax=Steinernema glaseri TaxID=37863 RepID=A0A1I8AI72_9BILA
MWGGLQERGRFVAVLSSSCQVAPVLSMTGAGLFCSSNCECQGIQYVFGVVTMAMAFGFFIVYSDIPSENRFVKLVYPALIADEQKNGNKEEPFSWQSRKTVFLSPSTWGLLITAFGDALGYQMFLQYGPTYMKTSLHFNVTQARLLLTLPFLFSIGVGFLGGTLLDKIASVDMNTKTTWLISGSQATMTICFGLLIALPEKLPLLSHVVLTLAFISSGLHRVGLLCACPSLSKKFAYVLSLVVSMIIGVATLVLRAMVSILAPRHVKHEWETLFYVIVAVLLGCNAGFCLLTKLESERRRTRARRCSEGSDVTVTSRF